MVVLEVRDGLALAVCRGLSLRAWRNQRIHWRPDLLLNDVLEFVSPFCRLQRLFDIRLHSLRNFILYLTLQNGLILFRHVLHILLRNNSGIHQLKDQLLRQGLQSSILVDQELLLSVIQIKGNPAKYIRRDTAVLHLSQTRLLGTAIPELAGLACVAIHFGTHLNAAEEYINKQLLNQLSSNQNYQFLLILVKIYLIVLSLDSDFIIFELLLTFFSSWFRSWTVSSGLSSSGQKFCRLSSMRLLLLEYELRLQKSRVDCFCFKEAIYFYWLQSSSFFLCSYFLVLSSSLCRLSHFFLLKDSSLYFLSISLKRVSILSSIMNSWLADRSWQLSLAVNPSDSQCSRLRSFSTFLWLLSSVSLNSSVGSLMIGNILLLFQLPVSLNLESAHPLVMSSPNIPLSVPMPSFISMRDSIFFSQKLLRFLGYLFISLLIQI